MSTNTDGVQHQWAVCVTCGGAGQSLDFETEEGAFYDFCLDCNGTGSIPAPVVPSDEPETVQKVALGLRGALPPTPSQDAEGDGAARRSPLGDEDGFSHAWTIAESRHRYAYDVPLVVEAAIRADERKSYEELVKAARASHPPCEAQYRDGVRGCDTHMVWWPEGTPDCGYDPVNSALTRIEESLGGRS